MRRAAKAPRSGPMLFFSPGPGGNQAPTANWYNPPMPALPAEIFKIENAELKIAWEGGHVSVYPFRLLRRACPCAACRDEFTGEPKLDPASVPEDIQGLDVRLVGLYALSISFSDGHGTGIYAFESLRKLCPCPECRKPQGR